MSIPYTLKVNERQIAFPITAESHIIGIIGITTFAAGAIRLVEVPQFSFPFSTVSIPGYTEIPSGTPIGTQFVVNYETGVINFSPVHDGSVVAVSYNGLGSEISAEDVNEVQDPLDAIAQLNITYNWPLAPTVSWSLATNSVTNSSISPAAAIDYSKLNLLNSLLSSDIASGQVVKSLNGLTDAVTLTAGANVTITPSGNSLIIATTGGGGGGVSSIHSDANTNITGAVQFVSGTNVSLTQLGQAITINSSGANAALSNLASVAINTSLLPGVDNTINLGSSTKNFNSLFVKGGGVKFQQTAVGVNTISLIAPSLISSSYTLLLPFGQGATNTYLQNDGSGNLSWAAGANGISSLTGDVTTSSINNPLGSASTFAVLANSTVTNTGFSVLTGDLGLTPGTSVTGFPPGTFTGTLHVADLTAANAQTDATNAYNYFASLPFPPGVYPSGNDLSGQNLGGKNLAPGVYYFSSSAALTGTLTLTGNASDTWVFQIGSTLNAASSSNIVLAGGALARNVFWVVGSSATLNSTASFLGTIIAQASITLVTGASNNGSLIALTAAVTLDGNTISATGGASGTLAVVVDVGGSSAANVHSAELLANAATSLNTPNTIVKRDGSGNFAAGTITATLAGHATLDLALTGGTMTGSLGIGEAPLSSAILDLGSTTQGFLLPRMSTTQMNAIVSPTAGLMVFASDTQQWMGFNGTSWVILG
jgi:hypothetical protein